MRLRLVRLANAVATAASLYTLLAATPVGGAIRLAATKAIGLRAHDRALVAYFDTVERREVLGTMGLDAEWSEALSIVARRDGVASSSDQALVDRVAAAQVRLRSIEGAVASVVTGTDEVAYAIERASAAGVASPERIRSFAPYLQSVRRSPARRFVRGVRAMRTALRMTEPIAGGRVTSGFGPRVHPILRRRRMHTGIDIAADTGTPILAASPGRVVVAAEDRVNGKFIRLDHGDGVTTSYCHASRLQVGRGARVGGGDTIALAGATGRATGPHLHFQVEVEGRPIDPAPFLARSGRQVDGHRGRRAALHPDLFDRGRRQRHSEEVE